MLIPPDRARDPFARPLPFHGVRFRGCLRARSPALGQRAEEPADEPRSGSSRRNTSPLASVNYHRVSPQP